MKSRKHSARRMEQARKATIKSWTGRVGGSRGRLLVLLRRQANPRPHSRPLGIAEFLPLLHRLDATRQ